MPSQTVHNVYADAHDANASIAGRFTFYNDLRPAPNISISALAD